MKFKIRWIYLFSAIFAIALAEKTLSYWPKSLIKIIVLVLIPIILFDFKYNYKNIKIDKSALYLSLFVFLAIVFGYFILGSFLNYQDIKNQLSQSMNVNKNNFLWIALYISFINAGIEEFFFRGLYYLELGKHRNTGLSALAFSFYHLAIMGSWISLPLLVLASLGLFVVGLVFNYLSLKTESVHSSYLVHMLANLTINALAYFFIL